MLRIYITGARGYIGSYLSNYLKKENITVTTNNCDICDYTALITELCQAKPDVVIHLAACSTVTKCQNNYDLALQTNVVGTKNLLRAMQQVNCTNIIYASTCAVYGNKNYTVREYDNLCPLSHYGYTKLLGEHVITANRSINSVIFRMTNVCGYNKYLTEERFLLFDTLLKKSRNNNPFYIYGTNYPTIDGTCSRDYITLTDVCAAYYLAALKLYFKLLTKQHIFNLCAAQNYTVKEILDRWCDRLRSISHTELVIKQEKRRNGDVTTIALNNDKICQVLRWKANKSLYNIINSYIKRLKMI